MWRDTRTALRNLLRRPGFSLAVVLTLALGIGANSSVFIVVNAVLLRELPFTHSERLVALESQRLHEGVVEDWPHSYLNLVDLEGTTEEVFEDLVTFSEGHSLRMTVGGAHENVRAEFVSAGYFELLGMPLFRGRGFLEEEAEPPQGTKVAVISYDLWRRHYEGQRTLSERSIRLIDEIFVVIGVAPADFHGLEDGADLWIPVTTASRLLRPTYLDFRGNFWLRAAGRLREGVSTKQAQGAIEASFSRINSDFPVLNEGLSLRLESLREAWFGDLRLGLWTLLGGAGFVLLIACTNVSNLLLARALERRRELAVRSALGAERWRLIRQVLAESVVLALAGGLAGVVIASWTTTALIKFGAVDIPEYIETGVDGRVIVVMTALSMLCGLGFGLIPALSSSRFELTSALKEGGQTALGGRRLHLQNALIVGEVVLAFVLLAGAAHTVQAFERLRQRELGFDATNLVTLRLDLSGRQYAAPEAKKRVAEMMVDGLESLSEVESVAVAGPSLPIDDLFAIHYSVEFKPSPAIMQYHFVSLGYFDMLDVQLIEGRALATTDTTQNLPVCLISAQAAERFWPGENALGKRIKASRDPASVTAPWVTVVGVVEEMNQAGFGADQDYPDIYFHIQQWPISQAMTLNALIRTQRPADGDLLATLRGRMQGLVPDLPIYDVLTVEQRLARQATNDRFLVLLMSLFTALALILAAVGMYGLLAYTVLQRNREFGIRLALGSRRRALFAAVLRHACQLSLIGVALGIALTVTLRVVLAHRVHQLIGTDPLILAGISLLLLTLATSASLVPAWRSTRVDPNSILRDE